MLKFSGFADLTSCLQMYETYCIKELAPKHNNKSRQRRLASCAPRRNPHVLNASKAAGHFDAQAHPRNSTTEVEGVAGIKKVDTEAGMLSGISRKRSVRSSPYWFTEFCNSQCLSHFAAPFIVVRAETSVAESCEQNASAITLMNRTDKRIGTNEWTTRRQGASQDHPRVSEA